LATRKTLFSAQSLTRAEAGTIPAKRKENQTRSFSQMDDKIEISITTGVFAPKPIAVTDIEGTVGEILINNPSSKFIYNDEGQPDARLERRENSPRRA
jgi:hypothetical protein